MTDELLQPTVTAPPPDAKPPWRIRSQFWIAFFGGPLPATVIAYLNARRLRLGSRERMQIVVAGTIALLLVLADAYFAPEIAAAIGVRLATGMRLAMRAIGVVLYLVLAKIQTPADRLRILGMHTQYDSLWIPGFIAWIGLGGLQAVLTVIVLRLS